MTTEPKLFLLTVAGKERLVRASSAKAAVQHVVSVQRATANDVARVGSDKIEDARED